MTAARWRNTATAGRVIAVTDMRTRDIQTPQPNPRPTYDDSSESARHENLLAGLSHAAHKTQTEPKCKGLKNEH